GVTGQSAVAPGQDRHRAERGADLPFGAVEQFEHFATAHVEQAQGRIQAAGKQQLAICAQVNALDADLVLRELVCFLSLLDVPLSHGSRFAAREGLLAVWRKEGPADQGMSMT